MVTKAEVKNVDYSKRSIDEDGDEKEEEDEEDKEIDEQADETVLAHLGLIDGMSKFFTPSYRQRMEPTKYGTNFLKENKVFLGSRTSRTSRNLTKGSNNVQMANKILKRTKASSNRKGTSEGLTNKNQNRIKKMPDNNNKKKKLKRKGRIVSKDEETTGEEDGERKPRRGDRLDNLVDSLSHIYCTENETRSHKLPKKFSNMIVTPSVKRNRMQSGNSSLSTKSVTVERLVSEEETCEPVKSTPMKKRRTPGRKEEKEETPIELTEQKVEKTEEDTPKDVRSSRRVRNEPPPEQPLPKTPSKICKVVEKTPEIEMSTPKKVDEVKPVEKEITLR